MRLAAVVPFHMEWDCVGELLRTLRDQRAPADELIFVIDGGDASDAARLATDAPEARILQQPSSGPAAARNVGFKASTGDAVVFLEADGQYSDNYFARVRSCLADGAVGVVSPERRIALVKGSGWTARYQQARWRGIAALTRAGRRAVLGGWAFRRDVFAQAGGYDERLRVGEDRDLVERVRMRGMKVVVARRTWFRHPEPSTLRHMLVKTFRRARQAMPFYRLHRPRVHVAVRTFTVVVLAAALGLGLVAVVRRTPWPLVGLAVLIVAFLAALATRAWYDPIVVAAGRDDRRVTGLRFGRAMFALERAAEQLAAIAGASLGSVAGTT